MTTSMWSRCLCKAKDGFFRARRFYARGRSHDPRTVTPALQDEPSDFIPGRPKINKLESEKKGNSLSPLIKNGKNNAAELLNSAATFLEKDPKDSVDVWSSSPYPQGAAVSRNQADHSTRPKIDPRATSIFLFPGQGSQFVGMGKKLIEYHMVKEMYDMASVILGYDLQQMCFEGPESELSKTVHCQPAILVTSLAAVQKLKEENPEAVESCITTAGFSIGEFPALVFAGAISFEDAVRVVKVRAEAMQAASELVPSGMMTVFFQPGARLNYACVVAKEWCNKLGIENPECRVANFLFPSCKVIAGNEEALQFIEMNARDFGIVRFKRLPVSGAFHSNIMLPAEAPLRKALEKIEIKEPMIPVHCNVDGKRYKDSEHIRKALVEQMSCPVKWEQILHILYERKEDVAFPHSYECGPGRSLSTILKKVNAKAFEVTTCVDV